MPKLNFQPRPNLDSVLSLMTPYTNTFQMHQRADFQTSISQVRQFSEFVSFGRSLMMFFLLTSSTTSAIQDYIDYVIRRPIS